MSKKTKIKKLELDILVAIQDFVDNARDSMKLLMNYLSLPYSSIHQEMRFDLKQKHQSGNINKDIFYWFHGYQCRFEFANGCELDVNLRDFGSVEALLDPYFVGNFIQTSGKHHSVTAIIEDTFHDTRLILETLNEVILEKVTF